MTKTIWITNGTEQDIDIEVKAVYENQCSLFRQPHIQDEMISRRATFFPGITRKSWLPRKRNCAKVTIFFRNEIVREETLCYGTEWIIDESSLNQLEPIFNGRNHSKHLRLSQMIDNMKGTPITEKITFKEK